MNEIQDLLEKTLTPSGILKKNRSALFLTIKDVAELVRKDALTAFNAHFPYLADAKKLQEHGDALLIPQLLHDTEAEYRERVATAGFFLMKAGERQYITGQVAERFTTRCQIREAFLNVQLKVADLSDDERAWALELLDSLLNPNIYTELAEWFHYSDAALLAESALYTYKRWDFDFFEEKISRDGRILRDGYFQRNGGYDRTGEYVFPDTHIIRLPITRGSGYRDICIATLKKPLTDVLLGVPRRDGTRRRDGAFPRGAYTLFETTPPVALLYAARETLPASGCSSVVVKKLLSDAHVNSLKRDGTSRRGGLLQRANLLDVVGLKYKTAAVREETRYRVFRNGMVKRDGAAARSGFGDSSVYENGGGAVKLLVEIESGEARDANLQTTYRNNSEDLVKHTRKRDGVLPRDGATRRSAYIIDAYIFTYTVAALQEAAVIGERFTAGMRKRRYRNGGYLRDGAILRDNMVLLPL